MEVDQHHSIPDILGEGKHTVPEDPPAACIAVRWPVHPY